MPLVKKCIAVMQVDSYDITVQWVDEEVLEEHHGCPVNGDCVADAPYLNACIRLSNTLTREQAKGVILHELSHVRMAKMERVVEVAWKAKPRPRWNQVRQLIQDEMERIAQEDSQIAVRLVR